MGWKRKQYNIITDESKPRHRVFCLDCGHPKLLFENRKKALNFIKFNGDKIEKESGYKPIRVYKCVCCCGWHVTSRCKKVGAKSRIENYLGIKDEEMKSMSEYYAEHCTVRSSVQQ